MGLLKRLIVVKNFVMVPVLVLWFLKVERCRARKWPLLLLGWRGLATHWSHKASTPSNKNTVNFDGRFHDGPNEPPASAPDNNEHL